MIKYVIVAVLAIAGGLGAWFFLGDDSGKSASSRSVPPPPPVTRQSAPVTDAADDGGTERAASGEGADDFDDEVTANLVVAPDSLDGSDEHFGAAVADMAASAAAWFTPEEQIRKWVVTVDMMADGGIPSRNRAIALKVPRFAAARVGESNIWKLEAKNYARLEQAVNTLTEIEPRRMAAYYRTWQPLFEKGYSELGKRGDFHTRLELAIARIKAVKPLDGDVKLKRPGAMYTYADSELEAADDLDKLLWRLGPDNLATIHAYLEKLEPLL